MIKSIIRSSCRIRRWHRRWPHWVRDLYGLIGWVNFFHLIPTIGAITCAPAHFFKRLPQILQSRRTLHPTPVKFFASTVTLFITLFFLRHQDISETVDRIQAVAAIVLLVPVVPILMLVLALLIYAGHHLMRLGPRGYELPDFEDVHAVVSLSTYRNLRWSLYLWGMFYLIIYLILGWQIVQVVIRNAIEAAARVFAFLGEGRYPVKGLLILMAIGIIVVTVHELVFRPYSEMLKAARKPAGE